MTKVRLSTHPGVILKEEFAIPLKLTQAKMAEDLHIGIKTISELYNEKRGITPVMALKLSGYFGTIPQFWMNLQNAYDLHKAYKRLKNEIEKIATPKRFNASLLSSQHFAK